MGGWLILFVFVLDACAAARAEPSRALIPPPTPTVRKSIVRAIPTATPVASPTLRQAQDTAPVVCPIPDLVPGQHISASGSYTERETAAAGPMICRVERDSCAYRHMIGNLDSSIVFKREEEPPYGEEDIRIHPAMLLPLTQLNELVTAEWDGAVRLRVTDAYDSLLEHDLAQPDESRKYSLHFEGRSIDLTTWPIEPARYGRLCALAHCAGFDWVHHEGDHCHASIKAESLCLRCSD